MPALAQRLIVLSASLAIVFPAITSVATGQRPLEVQASVGEQFGVGAITLNLQEELLPETWG